MKKFLFAFILVCMLSSASSSFGAEGFLWIGGNDYEEPYVLDSDCSGTGWTWNASIAILSLNSSYTGEPVYIRCYENVTLDITGNVTINGGEFGSPLRSDGDVILTGSAKVTAKAKGVQGYAVYARRNLTLEGNSELTAEGEGINAAGVLVKSGDITVNDNAKFTAIGRGEGYALDIRQGKLIANNNNVKLIAGDEQHYSTQENSGTGEVEERKSDTNNQTQEHNDNQSNQDNNNSTESDSDYDFAPFLNSSGGGCNSGSLIWLALALVIAKYIAEVLKVHCK